MRNKPIPELTDRQLKNFRAKVNKRGPDQCWEWTASRLPGGHGRFSVNRRLFVASRVAYYLQTGVDPGNMLVCHRCDNGPCCNPAHLFLGTDADNMADCKAKGRHTRGERQSKAVLTNEIVLAIRKSKVSSKELADKYGVSQVTVWRARTGVTWPHAGGEIGRKSGYKGASNGRAVLTERQARTIKKSNELNKVLAVKYGVHPDTIGDIKRGKSWRHLDA